MSRSTSIVTITLDYSRPVGPKAIHGGVTLAFDGSRPYSFTSRATWPTTDNYDACVRAGVESVLVEKLGNLETTAVTLLRITWHDVDSCAAGFERAARAATYAAFVEPLER